MEGNTENIINPEVYEVSPDVKIHTKNAVMENALIEARYNLTLEEQKLVLATIALLDNLETAPNGFPVLRIPKKLIIETTGLHEKDYKVIKNSLRKLMSRVIEIETIDENGKKRFRLYQWFSKAEYIEGGEYIEVQFHPDLKPYLLELKERFSKIPLKQILKLRSRYSIRLYELLKRYEDTGFRVDYIPELRKKLGVEDKEYKRFFDFERRVIKQAVEEINEKTDLEVSYSKKKTGRRITHIEFKIRSKRGKDTQTEKSTSESIDTQALKQTDLWETTLTILENVYKANINDVDNLRAFTYAVYKTDVYPKQLIINTDLTDKAKEELLKILLQNWKEIKEIVKTETAGNYEAKIAKDFTE